MKLRMAHSVIGLVTLAFVSLLLAACAVPGGSELPGAGSQPPVVITVLVPITPTSLSATMPPAPITTTLAPPPARITPGVVSTVTITVTAKPPVAISPTFTPTREVTPTFTRTRTPVPTPTLTRTRTATPTRTTTPTPEPVTREFYSTYLLNAGKVPNLLGDKGDVMVYTGERMPPGCEVFKVLGREYTRFGKPMSASAESVSDAGHGWSVTKQNTDPRDYGVKIHWWYNAGSFVSTRIHYIVRQPWNVDCLVPDKMQTEP